MGIGRDFEVDFETGDIRHVDGEKIHPVPEFGQWLLGMADEHDSISAVAPCEFKSSHILDLAPPFNIDKDAANFLNDGTILQDSGKEIYSVWGWPAMPPWWTGEADEHGT